MRTFEVTEWSGKKVTLIPRFELYAVKDWMGNSMTSPCICFDIMTEDGPIPYCVFTKSFGEFIIVKNCAYIDTNNCQWADEILQTGIARKTSMTKHSGFCEYPLWIFNPEFLKEIGGEKYQRYSDEYDAYIEQHK